MDFGQLIASYGYLALFAGCFLEGETPLILAGLAAQRGYLELPWVMAVAATGAILGDQFFFQLGRWGLRPPRGRFCWLRDKMAQAARLADRYRIPVMLGFRFFYGLRAVTPFVLGCGPVRTSTFLVLNIMGALIWAAAVGAFGFFFGSAMEKALGEMKHAELAAVAVLATALLGFWLWQRRRARRCREPEPGD